MEALNIENLSFSYPECENKALENISLSVSRGEFVLLCGNSGSGKSTLLRVLKKELAPYGKIEGSIKTVDNLKIGLVTQNAETQIVSDTVWHNLAFALENMKLPQNEIRQRIAETAEFFGLSEIFEKKTAALSGGEKQLLNLASVMVMNPDLLLLDEPTSQLDPIAAQRFTDILKRLNSETALTIVIAEHRTEELYSFADKVVFLYGGKMLFSGTADEAAAYVRKTDKSDILLNLPTAVRIYSALEADSPCPKNVRECKGFLSDNFENEISALPEEKNGSLKPALELKNIYFRYEKNAPDILRGVSMTFHFGEIMTVLGGNGCGKSTLLSLISAVNKPYSGKIKAYSKKISVLPQNVRAVFTGKTLREDFSLITEDFSEISESLGISHLLDKNPYDLSGGEAQRAALAKILLLKPEILCLDEPSKGIDGKGKGDIIKILRTLSSKGLSVIIVTHDADFAAEVSDRCMMLFNREIVSSGSVREFFSKNQFYTTYSRRASAHMFKNAVTVNDVVTLCKMNRGKRHE